MRFTSLVLTWVACTDAGDAPVDPIVECDIDSDCVDANPCNGAEVCREGLCEAGVPEVCADPDDVCRVEDEVATCGPWCDLPRASNLSILLDDDVLVFSGSGTIETAVIDPDDAVEDAVFVASSEVGPFEAGTRVRVLARSDAADCTEVDVFDLVYDVAEAYPGAAGTETSLAVPSDLPESWGTAIRDVTFGEDVADAWRDEMLALGPAVGTATDILALGRGGSVVVELEAPVADQAGDELAVFENGFSDTFLEFGRVAVSTDGVHFATFDGAARTPDPVGPFEVTDPSTVHGFAGVYRQGFGTPFDLARLRFDEAVRRGFVRLDQIRYVRIDDVVGDGFELDAFGRPIHDPFPTRGSAGFDLDAVGVLPSR